MFNINVNNGTWLAHICRVAPVNWVNTLYQSPSPYVLLFGSTRSRGNGAALLPVNTYRGKDSFNFPIINDIDNDIEILSNFQINTQAWFNLAYESQLMINAMSFSWKTISAENIHGAREATWKHVKCSSIGPFFIDFAIALRYTATDEYVILSVPGQNRLDTTCMYSIATRNWSSGFIIPDGVACIGQWLCRHF